jgi:hypothetical protein
MTEKKFRIHLKNIGDPTNPNSTITIHASLEDRKNGLLYHPIDTTKWEIVGIDEYTQVNDNQDKEIYERDNVLTNDGKIWKVYWDKDAAAFMLDHENMSENIFLYEAKFNLQVIWDQ